LSSWASPVAAGVVVDRLTAPHAVRLGVGPQELVPGLAGFNSESQRPVVSVCPMPLSAVNLRCILLESPVVLATRASTPIAGVTDEISNDSPAVFVLCCAHVINNHHVR